MNLPISIVVAAMLVSAAVHFSPVPGEWSMMLPAPGEGAGVWKLNARSGDLYYCWISSGSLECVREASRQ